MKNLTKRVLAMSVGAAFAFGASSGAVAMTPKKGGTLNFVVGSKIPSYDGHAETTFGMIHPIRPFYSLLLRINPDNPQSATDFLCDVCEAKSCWKVTRALAASNTPSRFVRVLNSTMVKS